MLKRENRWWDLPAAFFLLACLSTVAFRLSDTKWTENLTSVISLTIIGAMLGLALGYSHFKGWLASLIGAAYTLFFIPRELGLLTSGDVLWTEKLASAGGRLWNGLLFLFQNKPLTDPMLFLASMMVLFWIVSLIAGYNLIRHGQPWQGVLVAGIALLIIDIYNPEIAHRGIGMAVFVIFALLLVTRMYYLRSDKKWKEQQMPVDSDTGWSFGRSALVTVVLLVLLAWNVTAVVQAFTPATAERHEVLNIWRGLRQRLENAVAPLHGTVPLPVEYYSDQMSLGTGSVLTDQLVMTVDPSITRRLGINYYWKMRSYDRYIDGLWISTISQVEPLTPTDPPIQNGALQGRLSVRFHIRTLQNLSMLVAPSLPLKVSRPVTLIFQPTEYESIDVSAIEIDPMMRSGETYEIHSWVASPTIAQLKAAGGDYPAWVMDTYLQLPASFPESIKSAAIHITSGLDTPYDKATAITLWLRENIEYSPTIPTPPHGEDPIAWVIFNERKAFCNYYATAEVLMLRSLGIPARWVVGYAQGQLNEQKGYYEVRQKDSHAWPEVYFPGYGWIEFEPTASQPAIDRPSGENASTGSNIPDITSSAFQNDPRDRSFEFDPNEGRMESRFQLQPTPWITPAAAVVSVTGLLIIAAVLWFIRIGRRNPQKSLPVLLERTLRKRGWRTPPILRLWASHVSLSPIERAFISVEWVTCFLGGPAAVASTPSEQLGALIKILPHGETLGSLLLEEYQKAIYSPYPADIAAASKASRDLWKLAVKTRLKMLAEYILSGQPQRTSRMEKLG